MQIQYSFFKGGDYNPYEADRDEAYNRLTAERLAKDPRNEKPLAEIFPALLSWPDYLLLNSKSVFWQMERSIRLGDKGDNKGDEIEELWQEANRLGMVGECLRIAEADESQKAMCYYMALLHEQFAPGDIGVDFRLYISEAARNGGEALDGGFSLTPYE